MKIVLLLYHLDVGGVEKAAVELANNLVENGHTVHISTIYKLNKSLYEIDSRVSISNLLGFYVKGLNRPFSLLSHRFLYNRLVKDSYDLEIAFQAELPADIMINSTNDTSYKVLWLHGDGMKYSSTYQKYDEIIFVSDRLKKHYSQEFLNHNASSLNVVYNQINIKDILDKAKQPVDLVEGTRFISVGRLEPEKSFDSLIQAFSLLLKESDSDHIFLSIVGDGSQKEYLQNLIMELGIEDNVTLHGFDKNPYKYLNKSDVYVCTSKSEGFGLALVEAAVLGKSLISTKVGISEEVIGNNEYGILTDFSPESIKDAMLVNLDDNYRTQFTDSLPKRVEQLFVEDRNDQINALLNKAQIKSPK